MNLTADATVGNRFQGFQILDQDGYVVAQHESSVAIVASATASDQWTAYNGTTESGGAGHISHSMGDFIVRSGWQIKPYVASPGVADTLNFGSLYVEKLLTGEPWWYKALMTAMENAQQG
jgi:hypothetical protein